jgi:hypothetical protein
MTYRAVEVLRAVDRILAEDTRRTGILCRRYEIGTPLVSAHEHNELARIERSWVARGRGGRGAGVGCRDAAGLGPGRPPGGRGGGGRAWVVPVPGPSAVLAALVASGLPAEPFTFYGFLERSGRGRSERLDELAALPHTAVLYESPARLVARCWMIWRSGRAAPAGGGGPGVDEAPRGGGPRHAGGGGGVLPGVGVRGEVVVVLEGAPPSSAAVDEAAAAALAAALLGEGGRPSVGGAGGRASPGSGPERGVRDRATPEGGGP